MASTAGAIAGAGISSCHLSLCCCLVHFFCCACCCCCVLNCLCFMCCCCSGGGGSWPSLGPPPQRVGGAEHGSEAGRALHVQNTGIQLAMAADHHLAPKRRAERDGAPVGRKEGSRSGGDDRESGSRVPPGGYRARMPPLSLIRCAPWPWEGKAPRRRRRRPGAAQGSRGQPWYPGVAR